MHHQSASFDFSINEASTEGITVTHNITAKTGMKQKIRTPILLQRKKSIAVTTPLISKVSDLNVQGM
jgi:hypothetical protein